jgi:hypothetical protein
MARTMMINAFGLCLISQAVFAAPVSGPNGVPGDQAACAVAQGAIDQDRGKMENLMFALADEDDKPESSAQFAKMCALDKDISATATRLAKLINAAPSSCISDEDKEAIGELQRLSQPIAQCSRDNKPVSDGKLVNAKAPEAEKPAKKAAQPLKRVTKLPVGRTNSIKKAAPGNVAKRLASQPGAIPPVDLGLMGRLY